MVLEYALRVEVEVEVRGKSLVHVHRKSLASFGPPCDRYHSISATITSYSTRKSYLVKQRREIVRDVLVHSQDSQILSKSAC